MKLLIVALTLAACAAAPVLAAETSSAAPNRAKRDPNEVICKVQTSTSGHPERICVTRSEWDKAAIRTRQEMMLTQRGFCGGGAAC